MLKSLMIKCFYIRTKKIARQLFKKMLFCVLIKIKCKKITTLYYCIPFEKIHMGRIYTLRKCLQPICGSLVVGFQITFKNFCLLIFYI